MVGALCSDRRLAVSYVLRRKKNISYLRNECNTQFLRNSITSVFFSTFELPVDDNM